MPMGPDGAIVKLAQSDDVIVPVFIYGDGDDTVAASASMST